jgi:tRNA(Ile)-lysidine synthase
MSFSKVGSAVSALADLYPSEYSFLVAFSGGLDSTVLLDALSKRFPAERLRAVYVHHGLQSEADDWEAFTRAFCSARHISYQSVSVAVPDAARQGVESVARQVRYEALYAQLDDKTVLLTAHHQRDQAETFLLGALRGAGVAGLAAMPFEKTVSHGRKTLSHCRPLLQVPYQALKAYAAHYQLNWVEDPSNQDVALKRNFIRHALLPKIHQAWPNPEQSLSQSAERVSESLGLLDDLAEMDLQNCTANHYQLTLEPLVSLGMSRVKNALRYWAKTQASQVTLNAKVYDWLETSLQNTNPQAHPKLKQAQFDFYVYRQTLYALPKTLPVDYRVAWSAFEPAQWYFSEPFDKRLEIDQAWPKPEFSDWVVRAMTDLEAEALAPKTQLKKWFQTRGVPSWDRNRWPVLEIDGKAVAILGGYTNFSGRD